MKNSLTKGGVELSKVDDVDGTTLEGAVFKIADMNGTVIRKDLVTNQQGKISVSDLRPGDYQFIETTPETLQFKQRANSIHNHTEPS